jgi:hypothetical protein
VDSDIDRCEVYIPGAGRCEIIGSDHEVDSRGRMIHRNGVVTWNGAENEIIIKVNEGAAITAIIGEVDGSFSIWHLNPGHPPRIEDGQELIFRIQARAAKI